MKFDTEQREEFALVVVLGRIGYTLSQLNPSFNVLCSIWIDLLSYHHWQIDIWSILQYLSILQKEKKTKAVSDQNRPSYNKIALEMLSKLTTHSLSLSASTRFLYILLDDLRLLLTLLLDNFVRFSSLDVAAFWFAFFSFSFFFPWNKNGVRLFKRCIWKF